tara:strand:- start:412 stop:690 length:279 start_codon:yes stop_codon:yes gene_type:complete
MDDSYSQLKAYIEFWLSSNLNQAQESREQTIEKLTPMIISLLRNYGFKLFSNNDFNQVKQALKSVKMDKNMKSVLNEYNKSIEKLMEKDDGK